VRFNNNLARTAIGKPQKKRISGKPGLPLKDRERTKRSAFDWGRHWRI